MKTRVCVSLKNAWLIKEREMNIFCYIFGPRFSTKQYVFILNKNFYLSKRNVGHDTTLIYVFVFLDCKSRAGTYAQRK